MRKTFKFATVEEGLAFNQGVAIGTAANDPYINALPPTIDPETGACIVLVDGEFPFSAYGEKVKEEIDNSPEPLTRAEILQEIINFLRRTPVGESGLDDCHINELENIWRETKQLNHNILDELELLQPYIEGDIKEAYHLDPHATINLQAAVSVLKRQHDEEMQRSAVLTDEFRKYVAKVEEGKTVCSICQRPFRFTEEKAAGVCAVCVAVVNHNGEGRNCPGGCGGKVYGEYRLCVNCQVGAAMLDHNAITTLHLRKVMSTLGKLPFAVMDQIVEPALAGKKGPDQWAPDGVEEAESIELPSTKQEEQQGKRKCSVCGKSYLFDVTGACADCILKAQIEGRKKRIKPKPEEDRLDVTQKLLKKLEGLIDTWPTKEKNPCPIDQTNDRIDFAHLLNAIWSNMEISESIEIRSPECDMSVLLAALEKTMGLGWGDIEEIFERAEDFIRSRGEDY